LEANIIDSIGEFKRLVKEGAVTVNEEQKVESFGFVVDQNLTVKVGKKRFLKVVLG
jgi:tyrosyl-tRNA synthetase